GFRPRVVGIQIPSDSGKRVAISLQPGTLSKLERNNMFDLQDRMNRVTQKFVTLYTHERMEKTGIEWASEAVTGGWALSGKKELPDPDCYATVNGGPAIAKIASFTTDEVESVEVYTDAAHFDKLAPIKGQGVVIGRHNVSDS